MWLLMFPKRTNLCVNARPSSQRWAHRNNLNDLRHSILPRSTGLLHCLLELGDTVEYMDDCTIAHEGVPYVPHYVNCVHHQLTRHSAGKYGEEHVTLQATYFQGRSPKSGSMHWRCLAIKDIPVGGENSFRGWLLARW